MAGHNIAQFSFEVLLTSVPFLDISEELLYLTSLIFTFQSAFQNWVFLTFLSTGKKNEKETFRHR